MQKFNLIFTFVRANYTHPYNGLCINSPRSCTEKLFFVQLSSSIFNIYHFTCILNKQYSLVESIFFFTSMQQRTKNIYIKQDIAYTLYFIEKNACSVIQSTEMFRILKGWWLAKRDLSVSFQDLLSLLNDTFILQAYPKARSKLHVVFCRFLADVVHLAITRIVVPLSVAARLKRCTILFFTNFGLPSVPVCI